MNGGHIQQLGTSIEVYRRPENLFVAGFIGSPTMNFIDGVLNKDGDNLIFSNKTMSLAVPPSVIPDASGVKDAKVVLGIRPDDVFTVRKEGKKCSGEIPAVLEVSELLGHRENLYLRTGEAKILATVEAYFDRSPGSAVPLWFNLENLHFFDKITGKRI